MISQHDRQREARRGMRADHLSDGRMYQIQVAEGDAKFFYNYLIILEIFIPVKFMIFPIPLTNLEDALNQFLRNNQKIRSSFNNCSFCF
jgi:hypothetical protein